MTKTCSQCDKEVEDDYEGYSVKMRDKDSPSPDLEFYSIFACSEDCVKNIAQTGRVQRVSYRKENAGDV
jgi:hypothetical protein